MQLNLTGTLKSIALRPEQSRSWEVTHENLFVRNGSNLGIMCCQTVFPTVCLVTPENESQVYLDNTTSLDIG